MKITFVDDDCSDWEGMYIDGKLVVEDHRLDLYQVLDLIGVKYKYVQADAEWLGECGRLPDKLSKVKKAKDE